uniref:Uncharacterized protein n=1 Tax=viral metagenome TaxID=1070528 RepID=A0A6C0AZ31_9ZZZZ
MTISQPISWNDGEVSWDIESSENSENINIFEKNTTIVYKPYIHILDKPTPLYYKIKNEQEMMMTIGAIRKLSSKELLNKETIFSQLSSMFDSTILFNPTDILLFTAFSSLSVFYEKMKEMEFKRMIKLHKFNTSGEKLIVYQKVRRITTIVFITISYIFTKNVQIAE